MRPAITLLIIAGSLAVLAYSCVSSRSFDSRWNYHRAGPFTPSTPSISRDASVIVFDSDMSGKAEIYVVQRGMNAPKRLTTSAHAEMHPLLAPDGRTIAFARQSEGYQHVWTMDTNGANQVQVTFGRVIDDPVAYLADGKKLCFSRSTFADRALVPRRELFEVRPQAGDQVGVIMLGSGCAIAPDGRAVLRQIYNHGSQKDEIWLVPNAEKTGRRIVFGTSPAFSPLGDLIVYLGDGTDYQPNIMVYSTRAGKAETIASPRGYKTPPQFCLDGTAIIYRIPQSERDGLGGAFLSLLKRPHIERLDGVPGK